MFANGDMLWNTKGVTRLLKGWSWEWSLRTLSCRLPFYSHHDAERGQKIAGAVGVLLRVVSLPTSYFLAVSISKPLDLDQTVSLE